MQEHACANVSATEISLSAVRRPGQDNGGCCPAVGSFEGLQACWHVQVAGGHRPAIPVSFPQPLARLITACWAQSPAQRPSAAAVLAELQRMAATGALDAMDARPRGLFSCFG
jgi:hypothetical protein